MIRKLVRIVTPSLESQLSREQPRHEKHPMLPDHWHKRGGHTGSHVIDTDRSVFLVKGVLCAVLNFIVQEEDPVARHPVLGRGHSPGWSTAG